MAKREKRKTSLGNTLEMDTANEIPVTQGRERSVSESTAQNQRPKLFRSVREAMEFEAAEEETLHRMNRGGLGVALNARTLSSLEKTQADQAGYTVIRRRAISDTGPTGETTVGLGRLVPGRAQRGKQARTRRGGSSYRSVPETHQVSHAKRSAMQQPVATQLQAARQADDQLDEQRWLAAASTGAVLPGGVSQHPAIVLADIPPTAEIAWDVSATATWQATLPTDQPTTSEPAPSQQSEENSKHVDTQALPESMLSWLESALSLDEIRAPFPPAPPSPQQ